MPVGEIVPEFDYQYQTWLSFPPWRQGYVFVSGGRCNNDLGIMETVARAYIDAQAWVATNLVEIHATNDPAPDWDTELVALYQRALQSGVSGFFVAAPDSDIPGGPVLRVRPY